jgi:hypothetical protein
MAWYEVTVEFKGRVKVEVEAADLNAAGKKALKAYDDEVPHARICGEEVVRIKTVR